MRWGEVSVAGECEMKLLNEFVKALFYREKLSREKVGEVRSPDA